MGKQRFRPQESGAARPEADCRTTMQPPQVQNTLQKILEATEDSKNILRQEIGKVSAELGLLQTGHRKLVEKVDNAEEELN
ncbi:hypothetical protein NDU88_001207 [Pleurodeles waltl]|uniref:Uncharacterized protein n=1 Tax=Pleurodeles waltl TaxID=8319 RepID=A0AAV7V7K7_PLEWA|nr:hypothetical protein NDU88_001207 [Pleurodeles waltl]